MEGIDQSHHTPVSSQQNALAVGAELQARPLALFFLRQGERHEWALVERSQVVQFYLEKRKGHHYE